MVRRGDRCMRFAWWFPVCPGGAISRTSLLCFNDLSKTAQHRSRLNPEIAVDRDSRRNPPCPPDRIAATRLKPSRAATSAFAPTAIRRCSSACATRAAAIAEAKALHGRRRRRTARSYGVPVAIKDNIDAEGLPTTAACPAFAYKPGKDATAVARLRARRRHRHRQDQPRSVRDRPGRRALALWRAAQRVRSGADPRRLELRLGGRGRGRPRAAGARHRHGRLRPRARRAQQHRRPQAEPRACFDRGRRSGLPLARLRFDLRADHRRLPGRRSPSSPGPMRPIPIRARGRSEPLGAFAKGVAGRRADRGPARVLRRSRRGGSLRSGDRAGGGARRAHRRDRHRAVLRDRAPALRRAVGGGALHRAEIAAGVVAGIDPSGHPGNHRSRARGRARSIRSRRSTSSKSCAACAT